MYQKGDETAKRREHTGETKAYANRNVVSKARTVDCMMHSRLRDKIICLEAQARHDLKTR